MTVKITLVSATGSTAGNGNSNVFAGDVSSGGGLVVFDSTATNLAPGGGNDSLYLWSAQSGVRFLAGVDPAHGTGSTFDGAISSDGKFVTFVGVDPYEEFVLADPVRGQGTPTVTFSAAFDQVFVENVATGTITDISQAGHSQSVQVDANNPPPVRPGNSFHPSISADGSHIAFDSVAPDLLPAGSAGNTLSQIYVWDAATNQDILVSAVNGVAGTGAPNVNEAHGSFLPSISGDGNSIVFQSDAQNLPGAGAGESIYYWHRAANGSTTLTNLGGGELASISQDGRTVVFDAPFNGHEHIFLETTVANVLPGLPAFTEAIVDHAPGNTQILGNGDSSSASLSANGRFLVFQSTSTNLVNGVTDGHSQIYVEDLVTQTITLASVATNGLGGNGDSVNASISPDGSTVTFETKASNLNLVSGSTDGTTFQVVSAHLTDSAPILFTPATLSVNEDQKVTLPNNSTGIAFIDLDDSSATMKLSVNHGTVTLSSLTGLTVNAGANGSGTVTVSGTDAALNAALNGLAYQAAANFNGSDTLTFSVDDNSAQPGRPGPPATTAIRVAAVNDAPTVTNGTATLAAIAANTANPPGDTVANLFGGDFADAADNQTAVGGSAANTFAGIAVTANAATVAQGAWQYQTSGSSAWTTIGSVADATALVLAAADKLRFLPAAGFAGAAPSLAAHLIDNSSAITDTASVNLSGTGATGGSTQYSSGTVALGETVNQPAPTLSGVAGATVTYTELGTARLLAGLASVDEGLASATVQLSGGFTNDGDVLSLNGATSGKFGTSNISIGWNAGTETLTLTGADTAANYKSALDAVTFASTSHNPTNFGANASRTATWTVNNGSDSSTAVTSTVNITAVNDAPTVVAPGTATLPLVSPGDTNPAGATVTNLVGTLFGDQDGTLAGIAITGDPATAAQGAWQYSSNGGTSWTAIGSVSEAGALVLAAADRLRFVPAANFSGTAPLLTAHLVDNSATLTDAATVNLSTAGATGGATAYSTATVTIGETVANPITTIGIGDDTGTSATDGVTSDPKLTGTAAPGTVLSIFDGAKLLGTTTADSTGAWSYTPTGLADGAHLFSTLQSGSEVVFGGRDTSAKFLLWETDGTSAGTFELPVPNAGNLIPTEMVTVGNEFFFAGGSGGLWVSNGTAGGTVQIGGQSPTDLTAFGNKVLFGAQNASLWISDGTAAGTTKLKDVAEDQIAVIGSEAFFVSGTSLWKTDGTASGTVQVTSAPTGIQSIGVLGNKLLIGATSGLWVSDSADATLDRYQ